MFKINFKKILFNFTIISLIFFIDRISKNYILKIAEQESLVDIYINSYLNFYLIWNKGIAFGLFSFDQNLIYNFVTLIIVVISFVISNFSLCILCSSIFVTLTGWNVPEPTWSVIKV